MMLAIRLRATHEHRDGTRCRSAAHGLATGVRADDPCAPTHPSTGRRVVRRAIELAHLEPALELVARIPTRSSTNTIAAGPTKLRFDSKEEFSPAASEAIFALA